MSEDVNVEHLLDAFISIDSLVDDIWDTCCCFMRHLYWYKPQQTILKSKIEALADDHHSKPECLSILSRLSGQIGNYMEEKRLLTHALELARQRGNDTLLAQTLRYLSDVIRLLGFSEEGIG